MDQAKKKQIKKVASWVLLAALVISLAAMPLMAKAEAESDGPVASVLSGIVEEGTIHTALHGGGTLSTEDMEAIKIPSGVKITDFLVNNGDTVVAGTPLAAVDKVSVMTAITAVMETMEYLQQEIQSAKDQKISSTVSATAGGRVKKIFAQKGDSVQEVMLRDGALALLSLDGRMAVKIERRIALPTGEAVEIALADGNQVTGRVESNLDGVIVVTLEDKGYKIGQTVIVTQKDGTRVGIGELYVHNPWTATAFSGTIQDIRAKEETKVSSGTTLFTLTDRDFKATLEYMSALHREYEVLLQDLFRMYTSGTIDAPCQGTVSGIEKDSAHLLSAPNADLASGNLLASTSESEKEGWTLVLLSNVIYEDVSNAPLPACNPELGSECPAGEDPALHDPACLKACRKNKTCSAVGRHYPECIYSCDPEASDCPGTLHHKLECIKSCTHAAIAGQCKQEKYPHYLDCIQSCIQSDGTKNCPSTRHKAGCIESCTHGISADQCTATVHHYSDCIHSCISSDSGNNFCPATRHNSICFFASMTYQAKVALVSDVGSTALVVRWDASGQEYPVEKTASGWKFSGTPSFTTDLLVNKGDDVTVSDPKSYKKGDVIFLITGYKGKEAAWSGIGIYTNIPTSGDIQGGPSGGIGNLDNITGMLGGLNGGISGFGGAGFTSQSTSEEDTLFDLEGSTLMTICPESTVSLTITLDEQDISKVFPGLKATVTVQALPGQVFAAEVTEVSNHGTNLGGSSKFAVNLRLDKTADMIDGMSAAAVLTLNTREQVPVIPVAALAEQGTRTVVFTALDENGEPANPVPVTTGLSDGTNVEILEGLRTGDRYYYSYYDTLELDNGVEARFTLN